MAERPPAIPGFEPVRVLRRLGAGPVADSWLVGHGQQRLVVRQDRPCAARIGLDRDQEFRALREAHRHGLAPEPLLLDSDPDILLTRFVPGEAWLDRDGATRAGVWARFGALLRRVHGLAPGTVPRFEAADVFEGYARAAGSAEARALAQDLAARAKGLYRDAPWVLCHHDPHLGNVIGEPGVLIDWEYAALGHPLFDLAFVIEYHALDGQAESALLAGWAGEDPPVSLRPLGDFRAFVAGVNDLWVLAIDACD
jgi:aminoglycoside phosphotransferase (APT) family kinase protein